MANSGFAVVGGAFRGAKLASPDNALTHPMGAREKNALFNRLAGMLNGAKVLDAYAGTGALTIEALSRGAKTVTLVEKSPKIARVARQNLEHIVPNGEWRMVIESVGKFADETSEKFDIIIADPPYDKIEYSEIEKLVQLLNKEGTLVLSHPAKNGIPEIGGLEIVSSKNYAGAEITIYRRAL